MLHYDAADGSYTSVIPTGTEAFREVVGHHYGFRTEVVRDHSRCQSARSEHCECRAVDLFVAAPKGRPLFDWAVAHAEHLGIQSVIHNRRVWGFGKWSERAYTGPSPHTDHVHIGLTKMAAHNLTQAQVKEALGEGEDDLPYTPEQLKAIVQDAIKTSPELIGLEDKVRRLEIRTRLNYTEETIGTDIKKLADAGG